MNEVMFRVSNVSKSYENRKILNEISFEVESGEVLALLGLNGQGKSTLIKILVGLLSADSGRVQRFVDIKQEVGVMLQDVALPERIKVHDLINLVRRFSKAPLSENETLQQAQLEQEKNEFAKNLSGGKQRRLQYALAIANRPKVLILDEPTSGLDLLAKEKFWNVLQEKVRKEKMSILLISHDLEEVESIATRIMILHNTQIVASFNKTECEVPIKKFFEEVVHNETYS